MKRFLVEISKDPKIREGELEMVPLIYLLGLWCCFIISTNTDLFWDLNLYDSRVQTMACCSFGYFIYDSFSMIKHNGLIQSYDILLHHLIVFGEFKIE